MDGIVDMTRGISWHLYSHVGKHRLMFAITPGLQLAGHWYGMVWYAYVLRERILRNARWWSEVAHCKAAFWSRRKGQTRYGGDLLKPYLYDLLWRLSLVHIATWIKKADLKAESERDNIGN